MKYLISLLIFSLSINCFSQSNREILEEIREELEFKQFEKMLRDMNRSSQPDNMSYQSPAREIVPTPYRNNQTDTVRRNVANFYNLSVSEYLKRDEIGSVVCDKYISQLDVWMKCYQAKMLDISYSEIESRHVKAQEKCGAITDKPKRDGCKREIIILNKKYFWQ